jgi:CheY-like chemotaxis protein
VPTILVADDNSNIQKMVTLALKDAGIAVVAVGNGEAAVRKLPDLRPDLVLADIFMPVRSGYEVCEFVKRDERFASIPVVLLVGAFDPLDEHEVERVHADGVLKKPFVPPEPLIAMVKSLLEKSAAAAASGAAAASPMASAMMEPPAAPRMEKTQQLTPEEIAALTHQAMPAPEPEPEPDQFASQAPAPAIDEAHAPVAFSDMMEVGEEEPETTEEGEEAEEEEQEPAFEASSLSGIHLPSEHETSTAAADEAERAAHEEVDHWAGIKEELKQPDAEQPPIQVEFGKSEPVELVTEDSREAVGHIEVRPDPALVPSAHEWMSAPPAAPSAVPEEERASDFEPMRIEAESPTPIAPEAKPLEALAQDLHEEAVRAAPPPPDLDETQQFIAPPAPAPASTWGRVEEVMLPAVPIVSSAAAEFRAQSESLAPAVAEPEPAHEPMHESMHTGSAPAAEATTPMSSGTGPGPDLLIAAITQKVMDQLDAKTIEKLSRELVRPLIEALIRREFDKD